MTTKPNGPLPAWHHLNGHQIGKYAEYFTKMQFTLAGFDTFAPDIDDKGIDFILRKDRATYYEV